MKPQTGELVSGAVELFHSRVLLQIECFLQFLAAAIAMGATVVRVGFEDSHYLAEGVDAEYNWQVVEKLVNLIRAMGLEPATPDEARQMLNLRKR